MTWAHPRPAAPVLGLLLALGCAHPEAGVTDDTPSATGHPDPTAAAAEPVAAPPAEPVQMAIDPETGRDITAEVVSRRLVELEVEADARIAAARDELAAQPSQRLEIYQRAYDELALRLGQGSIGPATAAAGPLLSRKLEELADALEIPEDRRRR